MLSDADPADDVQTDAEPADDVLTDAPAGADQVVLSVETTASVVHRLRRAQGQIGGVLRMIEEGRDCQAIVTQMAAVSRAVDRAGFSLIAAGLKQCLVESGGRDSMDAAAMEKLFLSLA